MGLIADNHVDITDQELCNQMYLLLSEIDSEATLAGKYVGGRNGPFINIKLPIRQTVQYAMDSMKDRGIYPEIP